MNEGDGFIVVENNIPSLGEFGEVFKGELKTANGKQIPIAAKTLKVSFCIRLFTH